MEEVWKKIPNYENYDVSNLGKIRNSKTSILRKHQYFVRDMKWLYCLKKVFGGTALAKRFGVRKECIYRILSNKRRSE